MIIPNSQQTLFKYKLNDSGCSTHQANLLFKEGLLSFVPEENKDYEESEIEELKFLKGLYFDAGIPPNVVSGMLEKLEKPYRYSFDRIYWDYGSQEWKELPPDVDSYIEDNLKDIVIDNFDEFLEFIEDDDYDELNNLKVSIDKRLGEIQVEKNSNVGKSVVNNKF